MILPGKLVKTGKILPQIAQMNTDRVFVIARSEALALSSSRDEANSNPDICH